MSDEFGEILKGRARGPKHLGSLDPEVCGRAMELILSGGATPAQIGGFLLVGRAVGDGPAEMAGYARALRAFVREIETPDDRPTVTVTGGFDGKVRTLNVGAAASLVAAAAGGRVLMTGCERTPPKEGRTVFDALRGLGIALPGSTGEAERSLAELGFAAVGAEHYLPELHGLLGLRREMVRRTVLNVVEKLVSPVTGSRVMVGITHRPFLKSVPEALIQLGVTDALVYQAVEGSDEAPLDEGSSMVRVRDGEAEELAATPASLGLPRAARGDVPWTGAGDERRRVLAALEGEDGHAKALILYNAALRLWIAGGAETVASGVEMADEAVRSGAAVGSLRALRRPAVALNAG